MKKKVLGVVFTFILCLSTQAYAQGEYSAVPLFMSISLPPNVMIVVDNSGSMFRFAYFDGWNTSEADDDNYGTSSSNPCVDFNPAHEYYGYFDPDYWYTYSNNRFAPRALRTESKQTSDWDGNFLNWLTMRRVDIIRKVLTGGRLVASGGENRLIAQEPDYCYYRGQYKRVYNANLYTPYSGTVDFSVCKTGSTAQIIKGSDKYNIKVSLGGNTPEGIIQKIGNRVRWGLSFYHPNTATPQGGYVDAPVQERDNASLENSIVNSINNKTPDSNTPLAEVLWTVAGYFAQESSLLGGPGPRYQSGDYQINNNVDPYNYGTGGQVDWAWCAKSFVILITDGEPCSDGYLPNSLKDYANGRSSFNCTSRSSDSSDPCYIPSCGWGNYVPGIEDVALYAHINDLRPDDLEAKQILDIYTVFAFGAGSELLRYAAINGGFIDKNGNNSPDLDAEWDADGDGIPDTYFEAPSGHELEENLMQALTDILKKAASGTAVSVLATSGEGEANLVQAYFKPLVPTGTEDIKWVGYLQSLWVDDRGYVREDTNENLTLDIDNDKVIRSFLDPETGNARIKRFSVSADDPYPDVENDSYETLDMDEIKPIWEAGKILSQTFPSNRKTFTFIDKDNDQVVDESTDDPFDDNGEVVRFHTGVASNIKPYLGVKDNTTWSYLGGTHDNRVSNLIKYVRGNDTGLSGTTNVRSRTIDGNVWKLSDIVHSTPVSIARPADNYDLIYADESYQAYYDKYEDRETVIYVGANDGMLHAFTSWKYNSTAKKLEKPFGAGTSEVIGTELWAYIPQALLPHLKWLPDPDYTHVYYVDLKPKVVDAKIFTADTDHPNGWGTVLIGGLNLGGKDISVTDDFGSGSDSTRTFSPCYFAIDVTKPREPKLLWEKHFTDLGLTTSYPAVLKVKDKWFAVFGSGPTDYDGNSTKKGHIFIVDLKTGTPYKNATNDWLFETDENNAFMSGPVTLDKNLNYNVDAIYIGETYKLGSNWKGAMYKVAIPWIGTGEYGSTDTDYVDNPNDGSNPWSRSCLFDSPGPITAPAALSVDESDNTWVYFGTGRYLSDADKSSTDTEYLFGIKDPFFNSKQTSYYHSYSSTLTLAKSNLFDADPYTVVEAYTVVGGGVVYKNGSLYGSFSTLIQEAQSDAYHGWFRTLSTSGERVLDKASVLGGIVFVPTFVPNNDICGFGGNSYLYALYFETGTAYAEAVFTDGTETITLDGEEKEKILDKIELGSGMASSVGIHVGKEEGARGFIQQSTGAVTDLNLNPALKIKSGLTSWREK